MRKIILLVSFLSGIIIAPVSAGDSIYTLQNGLDNYGGCAGAYLDNSGVIVSVNPQQLEMLFEVCVS